MHPLCTFQTPGSSAQRLVHEDICSQERKLAEKSKHWLLPPVQHQFSSRCWWPSAINRFLSSASSFRWSRNCESYLSQARQAMTTSPSLHELNEPQITRHVPAAPPSLLCPFCPTATSGTECGLRNWSPWKVISCYFQSGLFFIFLFVIWQCPSMRCRHSS